MDFNSCENILHLRLKLKKLLGTEKDIADSIRYASYIQAALLPDLNEFQKILPDSFILNRPRDIVSGDFYWISKVKDRIVVLAADCTGHGVPGAFMSILGINFLNQIVSYCVPGSNKILNSMREYVMKALHQSGQEGEQKDGMDMSLCVIDMEKRVVEYTGANSHLIFFKGQHLEVVKADRMPIGVSPLEEESFSINIIPFKDIDTFYIFSDGYADQFGGENFKKLKFKGFKEILTEVRKLKIHNQKAKLEARLDKWQGDNPQIDDILVIGVDLENFKAIK